MCFLLIHLFCVVVFVIFVFFFFSSRRRHTRLVSDWSSDVCSSDLWPGGAIGFFPGVSSRPPTFTHGGEHDADDLHPVSPDGSPDPPGVHAEPPRGAIARGAGPSARSEERRVGKECRSRGAREHWRT